MDLVRAQVELDQRRLRQNPAALRRKWGRMARSPFAFLRGASPAFAAAVKAEPRWLRGLPGRGLLVGDLHLENVGVFHAARGVTFHVNDFDETFDGAHAYDVTRLIVSTLLARPELGVSGVEVLSLARLMLEGYAAGAAGGSVPAPAFVRALISSVAAAPPEAVLKKKVDATGRLIRTPEKTPVAPRAVVKLVPGALAQWAVGRGLPERALEVVDVTRRLAGTGSLGVERLLVLTRGDETPWLFDVKEVRGSAASRAPASAARLVEVVQRVLPRPPRWLGAAALGRVPVVVTRLGAKEDKLGLDEVPPEAQRAYARYLGALVGEVHRRGSAPTRWSRAALEQVLDAAQHFAGQHETAFLRFCDQLEG